MIREKFEKIAKVYTEKFKEYDDYHERFFTVYVNDRLANKADKFFTDEEFKKLGKMRSELGALEKILYDDIKN